ncbi:hypothetical protein SAMN04488490_1227 [Marinobacter sp. LV10R510-11A]|uniref:tetratricopeptide repeat protein n=1 Tax=Marinobacter sp. LV10R510-11A TaxID=1415568 RepID=UPI000BB6D290|nr:tetratricopeptide repeat protein [Marinobacter sp. LV10R510-11A]SOB75609.1 hypothetical protein SAMN04488490_1227 [Marinobacter sp. LV10R510-11A]
MTSSKEVFAKRREGQLEEAYQMALQLMNSPSPDDWDARAFGWCLIDLIKRDAKAEKTENLDHYRQQLESIEVPVIDEVLTKQREQAISLCNPGGRLASKAKQVSKSGRNSEAAEIYRQLCRSGAGDERVQTSLGWELYKISKELMAKEPIDVLAVKRNLNEYLKLNVEKPSLLHTCVLQVASKFAGAERFSMLAFSRLWGLDFLRPEDWERFVTDDGKELPSLAEKVIRQASKEAAKSNDKESLSYILPHVDKAISECPENIWLSLNKAKVLLGLGRNDDALTFALDVTRANVNDFWTWGLLGDISAGSENDVSLSCYCKSLLCSSNDKFTGKVRLKLAKLLIDGGKLAEAKHEISRVVSHKEQEGLKVPADIEQIVAQSWYAEVMQAPSNDDYYRVNIGEAETLLFSQLPWIAGNVGGVFSVPGKEDKPKRKLFLKTSSDPMEVAVPESKFELSDVSAGDAIHIKGERDAQERFQVHVVAKRESGDPWDVFIERVGVVDHVNKQKQVIHFIVDRKVDGVIPLSDLEATFKEGDAIGVTLSRYTTKQGIRFRILKAAATNSKPSSSIRQTFQDTVRVSNGLGFTTTDVFIPPPLIAGSGIQNDDIVSGVAVLNYDKKRGSWGWKAISVDREG